MAPALAEETAVAAPAPPKARRPRGRLVHRSFKDEPIMVESAHGLEIRLASGRTVLDACGGAAVSCLGHGNEEVSRAMAEQADRVSYVHTQAFTTRAAEDLADILLEGSPGGLEMAFFVGSGSEAVEAALKLARQYHYERGEGDDRVHIVARRQAYHGNTMASMSISSNLARKRPYVPYAYPHVSSVSPAFAYRYQGDGESESDFTARLLGELEDEFLRVGPHRVMAFVAEPVVGATSGCVAAPRGYLPGARALCDKYGILLVLDEVMCGAGRCGTMFAFQHDGGGDAVRPDILTMAKGLGGGYAPIAAVLIHGRVADVLEAGASGSFVHGHTYQAHPLSCAAALAVQKIIRRDGLVRRCADMGELLGAALRRELASRRSVGDIRGRGLFWAVEFVADRATKETFDPAVGFGPRVQAAALERGVVVYPGTGTVDGQRGDHVLLAPPYTVTEHQIEVICRVLREAVESQEAVYLDGRLGVTE